MNKVILIGNLTKDPEIKSTITQSSSTPLKIASFSIAVNDRKGKDGTVKVQYFNLTAFDKVADIIERYIKKGHKICVTGSLNNQTWDKPNGEKGYATNITVSELEMLTSKIDADRLQAQEGSNSESYTNSNVDTAPTAPRTYTKSQRTTEEPVTDEKLPVINVDELNVQMPF